MALKNASLILFVAAAVAAAACSENPVSPTAAGLGSSQDVLAKGKPPSDPPPPPPPPVSYTLSFSAAVTDDPGSVYPGNGTLDGSHDGLPSPGHLELASATVTGNLSQTGAGNFVGTLGGSVFGLTITNVAELPNWYTGGDPCQEPEVQALRALGLVGSPIDGTLAMTWSEIKFKGGANRGTYGLIEWQLAGVSDNQGGSWTLAGHSGRSTPWLFGPVFTGTGWPDLLVATVENSVIDFIGPAYTVLKCRSDYTLTLVKTP